MSIPSSIFATPSVSLEDDVAGKTVADHHVHFFAVGHITRLDIAHKADARGSLEQLVGVPQHGSALALLGTVVGQCYTASPGHL